MTLNEVEMLFWTCPKREAGGKMLQGYYLSELRAGGVRKSQVKALVKQGVICEGKIKCKDTFMIYSFFFLKPEESNDIPSN